MKRCISRRAARSVITRKTGQPKKHSAYYSRKICGMITEKLQKRLDTYNPVMAARQALRRAFSRSPIVQVLMSENRRKVPRYNKDGSRHKVDAVEHLCNVCHQWKRSSKGLMVVVDHIDPVVDPEVGFVDFNTYIKRMWCDPSKLQKICGECHRKKTNEEWFYRRFKDERELVACLEKTDDLKLIKKSLKRFTRKKFETLPYPKEFKDRVEALKAKVKK